MKRRTMKGILAGVIVVGLLSVSISVFAQQVSAKRHPNLAAAQELVQQAIDKLTAAQQANDFDMSGHAAKAKDLLGQAYKEIWEAAQAANTNQ